MQGVKTSRLILRRVSSEDSDFILQLFNEPGYLNNIGDKQLKTEDDAAYYIESNITNSYQRYGYGSYVVELDYDNTRIGICGLSKREVFKHPDLGYAFLEAYWSKGYAIESARAVLHFAKVTLGLRQLMGFTSPNNKPSINTLEKLGFVFERSATLSGYGDCSEIFTIHLT